MNKKQKSIDAKWQYSNLSNKRKAFLGPLKDWNPVAHKLAKWISTRDYIRNGWRSCLDSHMGMIIDEFPAADAKWLYLRIYEWLGSMEGSSKISDDDKSFISKLVKSYSLF